MSKSQEHFTRVIIVLAVGLIVYLAAMLHNERKDNKQPVSQKLEQVESTASNVTAPVDSKEVPGFDPNDLKKSTRVEEANNAVAAATAAVNTVAISPNPIKEDQTEDDRIKLHFNEMSDREKTIMDDVSGPVLDDYSKLRNIFIGNVNIQDSYRVVNPAEEKEYGMGEYEYILNAEGKCEIAEVSVNYRNNNEPRVLGYRRC